MPDALDRAGASLVLAAVGWTFVCAAASAGSRPGPVAAAFGVTAGALVGGRIVALRTAVPVVAAAVVAIAVIAVVGDRDVVDYANARGAVLVQGALAGLVV